MAPERAGDPVVQGRLRLMRTLLADLEPYRDRSGADLEIDRTSRYVVERILISLVDLAVGLNLHLLSAAGRPTPPDQRRSFLAMAENGVVDDHLARDLAPPAGLRNGLVHAYADIDPVRVAAAVPLVLDHFAAYVTALARWMDRPT